MSNKPAKTTAAPLVVMMTKKEADDACQKVNLNLSSAGAILQDYHNREGWKAQGYASFKDACSKEFEQHYGKRSTIYRLMEQATVAANVAPGGPVPSTQVTRELGKLPPAQQATAFQEAGGTEATGATAKEVVKKKKPAAKKDTVAEEKHKTACTRIGKICGKTIRENVENGTLANVPPKEAVYWAGLKDAEMADIQELVVAKRFTPTQAYKAINKLVTSASKLEEILNLALTAGGTWAGDVDGFHIVITKNNRR